MMDWDNEWMMARERSPLKITSQNRERWRAFWSKDAKSYLEDVKKEAAYYERIVERIVNEG